MITAVACRCVEQQRSLDVMAALHTSLGNYPEYCSIMNSTHNFIIEGFHPFDDAAVRFGILFDKIIRRWRIDCVDYVDYDKKSDQQLYYVNVRDITIGNMKFTSIPLTDQLSV